MLFSSNRFRNHVKERVYQAYDALDYAVSHPYSALRKLSHESTIKFILENCPQATPCRTPRRLMDLALRRVEVDGAFLEFGVFKGASVNFLAKRLPHRRIHGFDSFEGLPEAWVHYGEKDFSLGGKLPRVRKNVRLHKGYFESTLPKWLNEHEEKVAFLHIDCDLYSSTRTVLDGLGDRIQPGTVIVFDDYFNFPNWENDGHRALQEFQRETNLRYEVLGFAYKELAILVEALG